MGGGGGVRGGGGGGVRGGGGVIRLNWNALEKMNNMPILVHTVHTVSFPAINIWLPQVSTTLGESCENVGTLSCCNIFQESLKNVATTFPQNVVRKTL